MGRDRGGVLTSVAAKAGVSAGRVQHYSPSRAELLAAAFERANELAGKRIAELTAGDDRPRTMLPRGSHTTS